MENKVRNPYAEFAGQYLAQGFSPIPIKYGDKRPVTSAWTRFAKEYPTESQVNDWGKARHNIGICTGKLSGVIGLDLDDDFNGAHVKILAIVPDSPIKKRGAKGLTMFYRYNGESNCTLSIDGHHIGDVLSDGKQCVIPPSMHPSGIKYEWDGASLLDINKNDLPIITNEMWAQISELLCPSAPRPTPQNHAHSEDSDTQDITNALNHIPPDCEYSEWVSIGMGLHEHSDGAEWALSLWDSWSRGGGKYKPGEPMEKWRSFTRDIGPITIGTLFYIAQRYGYVAPEPKNSTKLLSMADEQALKAFWQK